MRKWMFQIGLVLMAFLAIGVGCNGEQPEPSEEKQKEEFEPFSFAVITELRTKLNLPLQKCYKEDTM